MEIKKNTQVVSSIIYSREVNVSTKFYSQTQIVAQLLRQRNLMTTYFIISHTFLCMATKVISKVNEPKYMRLYTPNECVRTRLYL